MKAVSAVILTLNEEKNIARCINAARQVVDEVVVLDSFSDDNTVPIARDLGARVFQHEWMGYARSKNHANLLAENDWILSLDADEILSQELIRSLKELSQEENKVYVLDRINNLAGKWIKHSGWYPDHKPRLFNRQSVKWTGDYVHETLDIPKNLELVKLSGLLFHFSYNTHQDHLNRIDSYSTLAAKEMHNNKIKPTYIKFYLAPITRFIRTFIIKTGFLDGSTGLIIALRDARMVAMKYRKLAKLYQGKTNE